MKKIIAILGIVTSAALFGAQPQKKDESYVEQLKKRKFKAWDEVEFQKQLAAAKSPEERNILRQIELQVYQNGGKTFDTLHSAAMIEMMTEPKRLAYMALAAGGVFALWRGAHLVGDVAKHYLLIPPLCDPAESSISGWGNAVKNFFVQEDREVPDRSQVVLSEHLKRRFEKLSYAITNAAKNDVFFRHYLFYGPPGTGKTMVAKAIAQEAGLEYMYFSAANLEQYSLEEGVQQIRHLFEHAKAYPNKLMIIMDEADSIFAHRDTCPDKTRTFLNKILTYTGTEQNKYVVIAITNRPKDFDEAALSRFGVKIKIDAPGHKEREALFAQYAHKYFLLAHTENRDKRSFFQWIFTRKPAQRIPLIVADDVFTSETFNVLAQRSDGLSGREIADVMAQVQHDAYGTSDHTITREMLFEALEDKLQDAEIMKDFRPTMVAS